MINHWDAVSRNAREPDRLRWKHFAFIEFVHQTLNKDVRAARLHKSDSTQVGPALKRCARLAIVMGVGLSMSACAQGGLGEIAGLKPSAAPRAAQPHNANNPQGTPQSELAKATEFWGKKFATNPRNGKFAVNYARNLKAMGQKRRALAVLQQASIFNGKDVELASEYGRLALDLGQTSLGAKILARIDSPTRPDWRVLSARGTALAKQGRHKEALSFFERASVLAPNKSSVMNNLAMAYTMGGQPTKAEPLLRRAILVAKPTHVARIRQNLSLVLGLQGKYDEAKSLSAQQIGKTRAAANVNAIKKLVRLKPKAAPGANSDRLIKLAKRAETSRRRAKSKTSRRKRQIALRRSKISPAPIASRVRNTTVVQTALPPLRSKTLY